MTTSAMMVEARHLIGGEWIARDEVFESCSSSSDGSTQPRRTLRASCR